MNDRLLMILACPICYKSLFFIKKRFYFFCEFDKLYFYIKNGIPVLLKNKSKIFSVEKI